LLRSLAAALLLGALLIGGALLMPDTLHLRSARLTTVSGGPIQTSLTMISSLERMQQKRLSQTAETPAASEECVAPERFIHKILAPLATFTRSPLVL
jgi:hypothetical protein